MALTVIDYRIFEALHRERLLPPRPAVLELGESEWYGDLSPEALEDLIETLVEPARRDALHRRLDELLEREPRQRTWDLAKLFYAAMLDYSDYVAIDLHGTPAALRHDLNQPVDLGRRFDMVIDGGTAEHVFDVCQFFRTCHDLTRPGGLMLHNNPFRGWLDHGFYNFNPTLYWDLAGANGYDVLMMVYHEANPPRAVQLSSREQIVDMAREGGLATSAMLYAVYRKPEGDKPFTVPAQGFYAGVLGDKLVRAWHELR